MNRCLKVVQSIVRRCSRRSPLGKNLPVLSETTNKKIASFIPEKFKTNFIIPLPSFSSHKKLMVLNKLDSIGGYVEAKENQIAQYYLLFEEIGLEVGVIMQEEYSAAAELRKKS